MRPLSGSGATLRKRIVIAVFFFTRKVYVKSVFAAKFDVLSLAELSIHNVSHAFQVFSCFLKDL